MNRKKKKKTRLVITILASVSSSAGLLFTFSLLCVCRIKELINEPPFWIRAKV